MLKVAVKHLIKELAIIVLFDKISARFGNQIRIRFRELCPHDLGNISQFYNSPHLWIVGSHPYDKYEQVISMTLYSANDICSELYYSKEELHKIYGPYQYFTKICMRDIRYTNPLISTIVCAVDATSWIVK